MADINDYVEGLNYHFTEQEKQLMDIFAECWEYCHAHGCNNCKYRNGNEYIKMMICLSYQYAQRLIAADMQEVRHGKWIYTSRSPEWADCECSECGYKDLFANDMECFYNYCPECGAKMDKERENND